MYTEAMHNDEKVRYLIKTLSRTKRKDYENYVVNAIWNRINKKIRPITQQYVYNPKDDRRHYFIDLYFPLINMGVECDEPVINDMSRSYNLTNEGGAGRKIRFLKNIMGLWLEQESRRQWKREGLDISFDELTEMALAAKPFQCFINPNDDLFTPQGDMPSRIREFCQKTGQHVPESAGEIVRCIFESLVLCYRQTIESIESMTGKRYNSINIVGGGTKEAILCQYAADASNRVVYAGPVEATAIGNIALQVIASGEIADITEAREVIRDSFEIKVYEPNHTSEWDEAYNRFIEICGKEYR